jgi:LmbE family N-acetylglucosaminyl deacetylase
VTARPGTDTDPVVFFHAHPDDEAIFTGGTIAGLTARGRRAVVVLATTGQQGEPGCGPGGCASVGSQRRAETEAACDILGASRVVFLGHHDSGLDNRPGCGCRPFATLDPEEPARQLATVLVEERCGALVLYDDAGVYGHPDHLQVHRVGRRAAKLAGVATRYEATVDREYLHFVDTHLVELAHTAYDAPVPLGVPTVLVDATIDVRPWIGAKRAAMLAHRSQLPPGSPTEVLAPALFEAVYGYEWYLRAGPRRGIEDPGPSR